MCRHILVLRLEIEQPAFHALLQFIVVHPVKPHALRYPEKLIAGKKQIAVHIIDHFIFIPHERQLMYGAERNAGIDHAAHPVRAVGKHQIVGSRQMPQQGRGDVHKGGNGMHGTWCLHQGRPDDEGNMKAVDSGGMGNRGDPVVAGYDEQGLLKAWAFFVLVDEHPDGIVGVEQGGKNVFIGFEFAPHVLVRIKGIEAFSENSQPLFPVGNDERLVKIEAEVDVEPRPVMIEMVDEMKRPVVDVVIGIAPGETVIDFIHLCVIGCEMGGIHKQIDTVALKENIKLVEGAAVTTEIAGMVVVPVEQADQGVVVGHGMSHLQETVPAIGQGPQGRRDRRKGAPRHAHEMVPEQA